MNGKKPSRHPERFSFVVQKGCFVPADDYTASRLRERGVKIGDIINAELKKARSPGFNRLAHQIGALCVQNLECFSHLTAHSVLKRLQIESGIACEETAIMVPNYGMMMHRVPLSLSFDNMDDGEFHEAMHGISKYIAATYWKNLTEDQIYSMAELMP